MTDRRSLSLSISDTRNRADKQGSVCRLLWDSLSCDLTTFSMFLINGTWRNKFFGVQAPSPPVLLALGWLAISHEHRCWGIALVDYLTRKNGQGSEFQYGTQWSTVRCSSLNKNQFNMCDSFRDPLFRVLEFTLFFVRYDHILCYCA